MIRLNCTDKLSLTCYTDKVIITLEKDNNTFFSQALSAQDIGVLLVLEKLEIGKVGVKCYLCNGDLECTARKIPMFFCKEIKSITTNVEVLTLNFLWRTDEGKQVNITVMGPETQVLLEALKTRCRYVAAETC